MTLTRTPLNRCSVKDCRFPEEEHYCWGTFPHGCSRDVTHQHWPKKGMGGRNSKSEVVAILCSRLHDAVDNTVTYKNEATTYNGHRYYRLWKPGDEHKPDGWALIWKEIPSGQEAGAKSLPGEDAGEGVPEEAAQELGGQDGRSDRLDGDREEAALGEQGQISVRKASGHQGESGRITDSLPGERRILQPLPGEAPDFGPDYLELPAEFTLQDAVPWAAMVGKWEHGRQWYAGDLLLQCEARFGHERLWGHSLVDGKTFVDLLGMTYPSLRNCQRVCQAFSPGERYPLSFGHHAAVYGIADRAKRDSLMAMALVENWTVAQLRRAVSGGTVTETCVCPTCGKEHRKESTTS